MNALGTHKCSRRINKIPRLKNKKKAQKQHNEIMSREMLYQSNNAKKGIYSLSHR